MLILLQLKCKDIIKGEAEQKQSENWGTMMQAIGIFCLASKISSIKVMNKKLYIPYLKYFGFLLWYIEEKKKKKMPSEWEWSRVLLVTTAWPSRTAAIMAECALIQSSRLLFMTW